MKHVKAEIITIGDEILYGHILDTNSQWMCQTLGDLGVKVNYRSTIGDNEEHILKAFDEARRRSDLVFITGGLGPTEDDLTKPCLAKFFDSEMELNEKALEEVTQFFKSRGRELNELNHGQAVLPVKCEMLSNKVGTAPGMLFHENDKVFISLPGVPLEMKYIIENEAIPRIKELFHMPVILHRTIKTIGIGESFLAPKIQDWANNLPDHISLAYLPSLGMVKLRLTAVGPTLESLKTEVNDQIEKLLPLAGKYIFGFDSDTIEEALGKILKERGLTLSAAESCTGGYFSHRITSVPGSSSYFHGGLISYDNSVKVKKLGVPADVIEKYGAVSEEVVKYMAENIRKELSTDIGVSVSGVAGPEGGTDEKPVGTVWICFADGEKTIAKKLSLGFRSRSVNIELSALAVMNLIRLQLGPEY